MKKNRKETTNRNRSVGKLSLPHQSQPPLPRAEGGVCATGVQVPHQLAHPLLLQNLQEDTQVPATAAVIATNTAGRHQLIHQSPHLLRLCVQTLVVVEKRTGGWMEEKLGTCTFQLPF